MQEELGAEGLQIVAVAVDEDPEDVRPWVEEAGATFPVLVDRDRRIVERYGIVNVPTVVWIDEDDRIVRPNDVAFGSDLFFDFHGIDSTPHHDALRRWVRTGDLELTDAEVRARQMVPTAEEQEARLAFRVALHLLRADRGDEAAPHLARAAELSPLDWTIRRAALPLTGIDPFVSEEFLALYEELQAAGGEYYPPRPAEGT